MTTEEEVMTHTTCPVCGAPLTQMEQFLAEAGAGVQCRRCWSQIHASAPKNESKESNSSKVSRRAS